MSHSPEPDQPGPQESLLYEEPSPPRTATPPARIARCLYISHALTTWNARSYEFGAILFTAAAFPDTLLWSSVRGMVTTLAALLFASIVGSAIDASSSRLRPLWTSISVNRLAVIFACIAWLPLFASTRQARSASMTLGQGALFAVVLVLGVFEKLSGIANMLCSERDWAPKLAEDMPHMSLTMLNAVLRRIDLACKLVAPLVISGIASASSMETTVWLLGIVSALSWGIELWTARYVWEKCFALQRPRETTAALVRDSDQADSARLGSRMTVSMQQQFNQLRRYFSSGVCAPSLALSLLHFSTLSYSATLITYLLNVGFSLTTVTVARTIGSVIEVSSTFIAPAAISKLAVPGSHLTSDLSMDFRATSGDTEGDILEHGTGLVRCGLWGLLLQLASLVPVVSAVWAINLGRSSGVEVAFLQGPGAGTAVMLFAFLSFSRLGLWIFDLTTQELTQSRVPPAERSSFAGTETSFVSLFELLQWTSAAILSDPGQFQYLATASLAAVTTSSAIYMVWVRYQRGHLFHWDKIRDPCDCDKAGARIS